MTICTQYLPGYSFEKAFGNEEKRVELWFNKVDKEGIVRRIENGEGVVLFHGISKEAEKYYHTMLCSLKDFRIEIEHYW